MGDITERVAYVLRIPPLLKVELEGEAKVSGVSLNAYLAGIIEKRALSGPGTSAAAEDGASHSAGHHEAVGERQGRQPGPASARKSLKSHRADPKDKAAQEHGAREKAKPTGMCDHRVPRGQYCKRCEDAKR